MAVGRKLKHPHRLQWHYGLLVLNVNQLAGIKAPLTRHLQKLYETKNQQAVCG